MTNRTPEEIARGLTGIKRVSSTVVIGRYGPVITRGYTEIHGLRFYDSQLVVGPHGEYVIDEGGLAVRSHLESHPK